MLGIREHNYNYDISQHSSRWPSYEDFLELTSWDEVDSSVRSTLQQRSAWDPIYHSGAVLKHPFNGVNQVKENYSQSWQDIFVLTMLNGKRNGTYLELGASDPTYMNNTCLLSKKFGWTGISIDFRSELTPLWHRQRPLDDFRLLDAWNIDYQDLFKQLPTQIDYLQVDLDETCSLPILKKLPTSTRFSVITFETDIFAGNRYVQTESRKYLTGLGYQLLIDNVAVKNYPTKTWEPFEDWYVDPAVIDSKVIEQFMCVDDATKLPHIIFTKE